MEDIIEHNLYWLLIRASIPAKHTFMQAGEMHGLTHMQLFTLCLIDKDSETPMHSITIMLGCDASNVTGIVDRLVMHGFIERSEYARDRRIKLIKLTEKGKQTRKAILSNLADAKIDTFANMTLVEKEMLKQLLTKALAGCTPKRI